MLFVSPIIHAFVPPSETRKHCGGSPPSHMSLQTFISWRASCSRLRSCTLSCLLPLALIANASQATNAAASIRFEQVSPPNRAAEVGYFGTCPESPDGRRIVYVLYDKNPGPDTTAGSPGGLYLCDADLRNHVKIRDIPRIRWHDAANQIWLDDDTIAFTDYIPGKGHVVNVIRKNGDPVAGPFEAAIGHGDAPNGSLLLVVEKRGWPNGSSLGSSGLYLYKAGKVTKAVDLVNDIGKLKDRFKDPNPPADWTIGHAQLSTNGTYISIRLDPKKGAEEVVTCKADGTDVRLFVTGRKPLHQQWYDDSTIFAHERVGTPSDGGPRLRAKRWDRDGKFIETLAGVGNHMGISPDRKYFASENHYELDPVILKVYRTRNVEPLAVLMNEPAGPVWKMRTHVNPSFSRDGKKVYFNKPVDGMPQVIRADISNLIRAQD